MKTKFTGLMHQTALYFQKEQLMDAKLWAKFVDEFRVQIDGTNQGWRGEFWGKMMRGAALVYEYTQDESLYEVLTDSVKDMMSVAEEDGRVSTYTRDTEFDAWDLWGRKYIMLACEYYLDICKDEELKKEIITFIRRCADYIIVHIGDEEGQKKITKATRSWLGLNSSSILEPIVKLYRLTDEKRYLDFATYIVNCGGAEGVNVFELAYENKLYPYQYGVSKAYEMMSCFEGLLEYYYATGIEKYKIAVMNFGQAVRESEISIIGCSGITHELFDHTRTRQTVRQGDVMQETCVTVTWMKFCAKLLELTGDSAYADCMEQSFYNAYLGSLNTERKDCPYAYQKFIQKQKQPKMIDTFMPVDSYSPLTAGKRGVKIGGSQMLSDYSYYGCCACIAAAGVGVFLKNAITTDEDGVVINFFEKGITELIHDGVKVNLKVNTEYPVDGKISIKIKTDKPATFTIKVRIPAWTDSMEGYAVYSKKWFDDEIRQDFDMKIKTILPETWEEDVVYTDMSGSMKNGHTAGPMKVYHKEEEDNYIALTRGPLTLAVDSRMGKTADSVFDFEPIGTLREDREIADGVLCLVKMEFTNKTGEKFYLIDYLSAGRDWETEIAAWLRKIH